MGEAKRRGSFDKRKQDAIEKHEKYLEALAEKRREAERKHQEWLDANPEKKIEKVMTKSTPTSSRARRHLAMAAIGAMGLASAHSLASK